MRQKIWRFLTQILFNRNDLGNIIKLFFKDLKDENIQDDKYIPLLRTFPRSQLEALLRNNIITEKKYYSLCNFKNQEPIVQDSYNIEAMITGDKINELQDLIDKIDIITFNSIIMPFREVQYMKIPLIQYCILKNSIKCFKFLLVNGYDDPNRIMEEQEPIRLNKLSALYRKKKRKIYEWDSMGTAIYLGNKEIIGFLEDRGIEKGINLAHIEAAILSYRNVEARQILYEMERINRTMHRIFETSLLVSAINNNIEAAELSLKRGIIINVQNDEKILFKYKKPHFI